MAARERASTSALEHGSRSGLIIESAGSSPRMWGTLNILRVEILRGRFIPTHVGNTVALDIL